MKDELLKQLNEQERTLLWLSERCTTLENRISQLENPSLMYKRPNVTGDTIQDYETIAQTLDYLHNNIEGLKGDLLKVAKAV